MNHARRWLRHPAAAAAMLAVLAASVWSLPKNGHGGSTVGSWIGRTYLAQPTMVIAPLLEVYVIREDGGYVVHDSNTESFDHLSRALLDPGSRPFMAAAMSRTSDLGFYAVTRRHRQLRLDLAPLHAQSGGLTDAAEARQAAVDWMATAENGAWSWFAERVRRQDWRESRVLWSGVLHDAVALLALAGLLYSLRWNLSPGVWRARRRARRLAHGLCPRCRYPIAGLTDGPCPECGEYRGADADTAKATAAARR